jgi:pyruvate ferredoxin oxidoreductase gamma subunit
MAQLTEVRWHGRGGQGAKTAGYVLAVAAAEEGWNIQAFPEYGAERRGAPMRAYVRISDAPIRLRSGVRSPDVVVVLDDTLLATENVAEGMEPGGILIVNTNEAPDAVRAQIGNDDVKLFVVDATQIAMDTMGRNIPNTPMLGALARASDLVSLDAVKRAVERQLGGKLSQAVLEGNFQAIGRAYEEVHQ